MNPASAEAAEDHEEVRAEAPSPPTTNDANLDKLKRDKHCELLENLLTSLDALTYIEIGCLYYLDCSLSLLFLRTVVQSFCLTTSHILSRTVQTSHTSETTPSIPTAENDGSQAHPGPEAEPRTADPSPVSPESTNTSATTATTLSSSPSITSTRSALLAILISNTLCLLLHLFRANPSAGEATQFYLHGSILIDFVGQLGPVSKWRLALMDGLVLGLQILGLAVRIERRWVWSGTKALGVVDEEENDEEEEENDDGSSGVRDRSGSDVGWLRSMVAAEAGLGHNGMKRDEEIEMHNIRSKRMSRSRSRPDNGGAPFASHDDDDDDISKNDDDYDKDQPLQNNLNKSTIITTSSSLSSSSSSFRRRSPPSTHPLDELFTGQKILASINIIRTIAQDPQNEHHASSSNSSSLTPSSALVSASASASARASDAAAAAAPTTSTNNNTTAAADAARFTGFRLLPGLNFVFRWRRLG